MTKKAVNFIVKAREGSRCKYNYSDGKLELESMLPKGAQYPENYGAVSQTLDDARKKLDGFLITNESIEPGTSVKVRPVACIRTEEEGVKNDKVVVVPEIDPDKDNIKDLEDLDRKLLIELKAFVNELCQAEGKDVEIKDTFGSRDARRLIKHCKKIYKRRKE
ncbi:MAG: inorganic diphosphatase [Candidatus Aenigmatarchaeota archaeon]